MLIADLKSQPSLEKHYIEAIKQRQVDGIISLSANMTQKLETLITERYPLVMVVQCVPNYKIPSVSIDNMAASKALMTHLIRLGHREIAHLTVSPLQMPYQDRLNGYISALEERQPPSAHPREPHSRAAGIGDKLSNVLSQSVLFHSWPLSFFSCQFFKTAST